MKPPPGLTPLHRHRSESHRWRSAAPVWRNPDSSYPASIINEKFFARYGPWALVAGASTRQSNPDLLPPGWR